ncbi:response regulator [Chloracidobacterium aggregatum]|jgi:two-component system cell cycle response regulator DivK|uniref:Response regulator n=1 Tax=Chloracidobacterium sp. N TaxID=2821540 RepID=A0ABX8B2T2_9BACT|nr:response regulator [Chloracidobacterium aggregatum]QUV85331.1 response regulator [Chloracidobacterium sp. 2]QUV88268.1 response regulator [Chloracidobacterium sp. S]QUV91187.1 response regulator [Chloracidobacterium sp. A]QUV94372.1 response regulator [Chloracidobacterium sp. N]QUV97571.1 response regulator [Chloracidobacterium sp. E]
MTRILVVEDNADSREILTLELEAEGYEVCAVGDGLSAVEAAAQFHPDVIVMDISLPNLDGLEATRRIKAQPALARVPVIALTAHAMTEDEARFRAAGCDAYLAKPASPDAVQRVVQQLLAHPDRSHQAS